jgi:hypothetical protein
MQHPNEWQIYAFDKDWRIVFAGVHNAKRACQKSAHQIWRKWRLWRFTYDHAPENARRDYPAKHDKPVMWLGFQVIGQRRVEFFNLVTGEVRDSAVTIGGTKP